MEEPIGEGTYGKVLFVRNGVVKKTIKHNWREMAHLVLVEAWILHRFRHPNLVRGLGVCIRSPASIDVYMQDAGVHLREAMRQGWGGGTLPLLKQLLRGVAHLHAHKVIHRDLKPHNVMVMPNGTLRIGDFGASAMLHTWLGFTTHVTSRHYRSPEQLLLQPSGMPSDIWAVGCILAEMCMLEHGADLHPLPLFPGKHSEETPPPGNVWGKICNSDLDHDQILVVAGELARLHACPAAGHDPTGLRAGVRAVRAQTEQMWPLHHPVPRPRAYLAMPRAVREIRPEAARSRLSGLVPRAWLQELLLPMLHVAPQCRPSVEDVLEHPLLLAGEARLCSMKESEETVRMLRKLCGMEAYQAHAQLYGVWRQTIEETAG